MKQASHTRTNPVLFYSYEVSREVRLIESRKVGVRGWGEENVELVFKGCRILALQDEKNFSHSHMNILDTSEFCILNSLRW